jgi:hypothetical protein
VVDQVIKDSSGRDPKMETYCKEVWCFEDKFHSLELNHVARRYNEATDELTKITSNRATVPPDVFSRVFMNLPSTPGRLKGPTVHCLTPTQGGSPLDQG